MKKETVLAIIGVAIVLALVWLGFSKKREEGKKPAKPTVVVYVSEKRSFSEPILKDFERASGIEVRAVYDTEKTDGTSIVNRLITEKPHPKADVYWANEPVRAELLKQKGVLAPYASRECKTIPVSFKDRKHYWCGFSARVRLLVADANLSPVPDSIFAYTDPVFEGKGVIARPHILDITAAHMAALFVELGNDRAEAFMNAMHKNGVMMSPDTRESAELVAMGHAGFALVDSDDAVAQIRKGAKIKIIYPDQKKGQMGAFVVPNAVMMIKNAPHPENAKKLIDYLLSKETEAKLAKADCALIPLHAGVSGPDELRPIDQIRIMDIDYAKIAKKMIEIQPFLHWWARM